MPGICILLFFLFSGMLIGEAIFCRRDKLTALWMGSVLGLILMMILPCAFAFIYDFTQKSVYISMAVCVLADICAALFIRFSGKYAKNSNQNIGMRTFLCIVVPFSIMFIYLQYTHYFRNVGSALFVGQSTYGDICMHSAIITSLPGSAFPPEYSILPGARLGYPFFSDALSACMYMFSTPLSLSMTIPGSIMGIEVFIGFYLLAVKLTSDRKAAVFAFLLFFLNGGLGFIYSLDLASEDPSRFIAVFNDYYAAPANMPDHNLRFVNIICDMMVPQRTFTAGIMVLLPALYMLYDITYSAKRHASDYIILGLWAGAMPMIHTHSFLSLGIFSVTAMIFDIVRDHSGKVIGRWLLYGSIAAILAFPQLLLWTFPQSSSGAVGISIGWVNNEGGVLRDETIWFWLKNLGLPLLFIPGGIASASRKSKALAFGAAAAFIAANIFRFQTLLYDNNKIMYAALAVLYPLAAKNICDIYRAIRGIKFRRLLAGTFICVSLLSGIMSVIREGISDYMIFSSDETEAAEFLRTETEERAVVLSGKQHNNLASVLAGKSLVCGASNFLYTHGLDYDTEAYELALMFEHPGEYGYLFEKYDVRYILLSQNEFSQYDIDTQWYNTYCETVFENDTCEILRYPDAT